MRYNIFLWIFGFFSVVCICARYEYTNSLLVFSVKDDKKTWKDALAKCGVDNGRLLVANRQKVIKDINAGRRDYGK